MQSGHIYRSPRGPVRALRQISETWVNTYCFVTGEESPMPISELGREMEPLEAAEAVQRTFAQVAALRIAPKPPKKVKKATA